MAEIETWSGYTRIANELVDALARINLTAYEWRVLLCIIRYTYGWNRREAYISYSTFFRVTGIQPKHVCRTVRALLYKGLISVKKEKARCGYAVQNDFRKWILHDKGVPCQEIPYEDKNIPSSGYTSIPVQGIERPLKSHVDKGQPGPKENIKDMSKEISLRERLIEEMGKIFPSLSCIPDYILPEKMDYLAYKVRCGEIKAGTIKNPVAYLKSLTVCETFPSFEEREAEAERKRLRERERREMEEEERQLAVANADFNRNKVRELIAVLETGKAITQAMNTKC